MLYLFLEAPFVCSGLFLCVVVRGRNDIYSSNPTQLLQSGFLNVSRSGNQVTHLKLCKERQHMNRMGKHENYTSKLFLVFEGEI